MMVTLMATTDADGSHFRKKFPSNKEYAALGRELDSHLSAPWRLIKQ